MNELDAIGRAAVSLKLVSAWSADEGFGGGVIAVAVTTGDDALTDVCCGMVFGRVSDSVDTLTETGSEDVVTGPGKDVCIGIWIEEACAGYVGALYTVLVSVR